MQKTPYKNPKKILAQIWRTLKRKISATCCFQLVTLTFAEREGHGLTLYHILFCIDFLILCLFG